MGSGLRFFKGESRFFEFFCREVPGNFFIWWRGAGEGYYFIISVELVVHILGRSTLLDRPIHSRHQGSRSFFQKFEGDIDWLRSGVGPPTQWKWEKCHVGLMQPSFEHRECYYPKILFLLLFQVYPMYFLLSIFIFYLFIKSSNTFRRKLNSQVYVWIFQKLRSEHSTTQTIRTP